MYVLIIPFIVLIAIVLIKQIPVIGGKVPYALLVGGALIMVLTKSFAPMSWLNAIVEGLNRMAWVIFLCIFVNFYSQTQIRLGTIDAVVRMLRAVFGTSPRALLTSTFVALVFCGAFTGSTMACVTVVGLLVARSLYEAGLSEEKVASTIVMGAMLGSLMPPISSSFFASSALSGVDLELVMGEGVKVIGFITIVTLIYVVFVFGRDTNKNFRLSGDREKISDIWRECRINMIPMFMLILIIVFKQCFSINIIGLTVGKLLSPLSEFPIIGGAVKNYLVLAFLVIALIGFIYPQVHAEPVQIVKDTYKVCTYIVPVMLAASFLVGAVVTTGCLDMVTAAAEGLNPNALIIGGSAAMAVMGMITGGDSSALNAIFPFFFPALSAIGIAGLNITMAGSLISVAGQALPPSDTLVFMACGMLSGILGVKKIDPMKVMMLGMPISILMIICGLFYLYV